jgi:phage-related protein
MPEDLQHSFGYALYFSQTGRKHHKAKPLKGFGSAGVLEIVEDLQGNAYRAVYTIRFAHAAYVLHCFQKKSLHSIATPKPDLAVIRERLKAAEDDARERRQ